MGRNHQGRKFFFVNLVEAFHTAFHDHDSRNNALKTDFDGFAACFMDRRPIHVPVSVSLEWTDF